MTPRSRRRSFGSAAFAAVFAIAFSSSTALATFPGANGRIAFVADGSIHTIRPNGTDDQRLVGSTGAEAFGPSWSADGQHIVYSQFLGPQQAAIFTMRADGSAQRRLTHSQFSEGGAAYSPSGRRIVFGRNTARPNRYVIISLRSDGTDELVLARGRPGGPEYSPSGKRIVYTNASHANDSSAVWKMRPDGSHKRQLTSPSTHQGDNVPHYSPDGKHIIFQRTGRHQGSYVVRSDGSHLHRVDCGEVYSPNGRKFAWAGLVGDRLNPVGDIFTSTVRCTDTFRVTHYGDSGGPGAGGPSWQPLP